MNNLKNPIEFLEDELKKQGFLYDLDIEVANEMFERHIQLAYNTGVAEILNNIHRKSNIYFKETYGKNYL